MIAASCSPEVDRNFSLFVKNIEEKLLAVKCIYEMIIIAACNGVN
jgi:hypothetical protein